MSLSITNNVASLTAQINLSRSSSALATSLERLSSGLKINRGADGPAALVISEQQRAQITGLNAAIQNTGKATSLVQTGEGALNEINALLLKIRGLAIDSANTGVNDTNTLAANQAEITNALNTIDRIATTTQFGTKKLLDGSAAATATIGTTGAANLASVTAGSNTVAGTYNIAVTQQGTKAQLVGANAFAAATNVSTTTNGSVAAISGSATISATNTQVGTYNVVVTQQGIKGGITAAAAGATAGAAGTISFTGGLLAGTVTANIANTDTLATQAASIQTALNTATGSGGAGAGVYTATVNSSNVIVITSNKFGAEASGSLQVSALTGTAGASTGFATGANTNQIANQAIQVQISGGNLSSPVTQTGSGTNGDQISISSGVANGLQFTVASSGNASAAVGATAAVNVTGGSSLTLGTGANATTINLNAQNADTLAHLVAAINQSTSTTSVTASSSVGNTNLVLTANAFGGTNFAFAAAGSSSGVVTGQGFFQNAQALQAKIFDASGAQLGGVITGSGPGGNVITALSSTNVNFGNANGISFTFNSSSTLANGVAGTQSPAVAGAGTYTSSVTLADALVFQLGANANQTTAISIQKVTSDSIGQNVAGLSNANTSSLRKVDVTTATGSNDAISVVDQAISDITNLRGKLGAFQANTLQSTANNLQRTLQNTTAAESLIRDTDFAAEAANFTKDQVLVQAGTTVLQNANQTAALVLTLLK